MTPFTGISRLFGIEKGQKTLNFHWWGAKTGLNFVK